MIGDSSSIIVFPRGNALCNMVQRIPTDAAPVGIGRPSIKTADPDIPGSAAIRTLRG
jgi:hypothetical protein